MTPFALIEELLRYAVRSRMLEHLDVDMARNLLYQKFGLTGAIDEEVSRRIEETDAWMRGDFDWAADFELYEWFDRMMASMPSPPKLAYEKDILLADTMNLVMHRNRELNRIVSDHYTLSPQHATEFFYQYAIDSGYIRMDRVAKNKVWRAASPYGELDITINLSKPEKSPEEIALMKTMKSAVYPKCMLCKENIGFEGLVNYPPRQNLRILEIELGGEPWYFQYSPYVYYNEHAIALSAEHRPMVIDRGCFERLMDFVDRFPHYFVGSNADLPIVGGSILTHDHYQAGHYEMPMFRASARATYRLDSVRIRELHWPLTVLELSSPDRMALVEAAERIRAAWTDYNDIAYELRSHTDAERHNTVTPIARFDEMTKEYILYLALRNNRTSEEHPQGIFHPHAEYHHIKRENIGLIEVMGLAVLPGRLVNEMEEIAGLLSTSSPIEESNPHCRWAAEGMKRFRGAPVYKEILGHLYQEIGSTYGKLLEDSGIFKGDTRGVERFLFSVFGVEVTRYHQLNCGEAHIEIASLGAAMRRFTLDGEDVLHGYANPADYRTNPNNVNCVIAPNAGRIEGARLGDRVLDANEGENNLHSGFANTKYFSWNEEESSEDRLVLSYCHPHGFGGFDGCIELRAEWKLAADHLEFVITGRGPCGTHLNATNHNYYRLAPEAKVSVRADRFLRAGEGNIPREPLALSDHARYDLRSPREYREILETTGGIDHVYLLSFEDGERTQQAATIECAGHLLSFYSEQEAVVVYTANHDFCTHRGICLEFQGVPNREHPMRDGTYSNQLMIQWGRQQNESNVRQSGDRSRLL